MSAAKYLVRVPPPLAFGLAFLAGVGLQRLAPITIRPASAIQFGQEIGIGLIVCGTVNALHCVGIFFANRTTVVPFATASSLVTWGPYRFSRNPMYVSVVAVYLGAAAILLQMWALLFLPLPVLFLHKLVIPFEDSRLREVFGETYDRYCARVRRWL
ncbi:MAG: isoprenylcysteine carboxylmethyltransferase family protein [Candidatus Hydrogenedentes bacterium]|nr:isoprenylcysteine carboxylmethyltransferase family protein [Candidatus Hydrogenedentota bacterium]